MSEPFSYILNRFLLFIHLFNDKFATSHIIVVGVLHNAYRRKVLIDRQKCFDLRIDKFLFNGLLSNDVMDSLLQEAQHRQQFTIPFDYSFF